MSKDIEKIDTVHEQEGPKLTKDLYEQRLQILGHRNKAKLRDQDPIRWTLLVGLRNLKTN